MPKTQSSSALNTQSGKLISDTEYSTLLELITEGLGLSAMLQEEIMKAQRQVTPKLFMDPLSTDLKARAVAIHLNLRALERFVVDLRKVKEPSSF
jgi:hypothetical protein